MKKGVDEPYESTKTMLIDAVSKDANKSVFEEWPNDVLQSDAYSFPSIDRSQGAPKC